MFSKTTGHSLVDGARYGALVWLAYAQVEYALCTLFPLRFDGATLPVWHWWWTAALFAVYGVTGAVLGAIVTALVTGQRSETAPVAAYASALGFTAAYTLWLFVSGAWRGTGVPGVILSAALAATLISSLRTAPKFGWRAMLACPWFAPVLLLSPFKIAEYWRVRSTFKSAVIFAAFAAAACIAVLVISRAQRLAALFSAPAFIRQRTAALAASIAVLFIMSAAYSRDLPAPPPRGVAATGRPNVLLVIWDTVRADRQSLYGYGRDTTPFLRSYAQNATLYKNAFAASDMTLSSSSSIFTGLYASWHGAHFSRVAPYGRPLDNKFETIATSLRRQGYTTMAVLSNCSYLSPGYRLNRGFQLYDVRTPIGSDGIEHSYYLRAAVQRILALAAPAGELDRRFRRGDEITGDALKLLGAARGGAPFFLTLNYMDAHLPYLPPPPYDRLFPGKDTALNFEDLERLRRDVLELKRMPTTAEYAHINSQYDGAMAFLDSEFQKLVAGLKSLGVYDNTLIVLTADHGEALGDRHLMEHAVSVYQDQVHVPLLVKYPGQQEGAIVTAPVSGVDVMPTILETAGAPPVPQVQGRSLQHPDDSRMVISESFRSGLLVGWHRRFDRVERAIVRGPIKFIQSTAGKAELYNLAADPQERTNLIEADGPDQAELSRSLSAMLAAAPAERAPAKGMDKQSIERLRSLGYVQ